MIEAKIAYDIALAEKQVARTIVYYSNVFTTVLRFNHKYSISFNFLTQQFVGCFEYGFYESVPSFFTRDIDL